MFEKLSKVKVHKNPVQLGAEFSHTDTQKRQRLGYLFALFRARLKTEFVPYMKQSLFYGKYPFIAKYLLFIVTVTLNT